MSGHGDKGKRRAPSEPPPPIPTPPVGDDAEKPAPDTVPAPAPQTDPYVPSPRRVQPQE